MLHDLANDVGFVALKWTAEDTEGWRHRERMSKTCCTAQNTTDDDGTKIDHTEMSCLEILQAIQVYICWQDNAPAHCAHQTVKLLHRHFQIHCF